jgi:hypothetical protein
VPWRRRLELGAILALAFAYAFLVQPSGDNQKSHYALVQALAHGQPYIDEYVRDPALTTVDSTRFDGHVYAAKAPGLAFFSLPAYVALKAAGVETGGDPERILWALHLWGSVLPALVLLLLVRWLADRFEQGLGIAAAVTLGGASLVLPFATVYFAHVLSATLGFAAYVVLRRERDGPERPGLVAAAGLLAGLALTVEYPLGLAGVALFLYALVSENRLRRAAAYAIGAIAGALPALVFNWWAFGSPTHFPYEGWTAGDGTAPYPGVFGLTYPDFHILLALLLAPAGLASLAVGALGAVVLYRRGARADGALMLGLPLGYLLYNAASVEPFGGASPGPRYLIAAMPFLAAGLGPAYRLIGGAALGLAVAAGAFLVAATITSPLAAWDLHVVDRLRTHGFVRSVLDFAGIGGGYADLPFLVAVAFAAAVAFTAVRPYLERRDLAAFAVSSLAWAVIGSQSHRLVEHGPSWRVDAALLLVTGVAAAALAWVYGVLPGSPARRRGDGGLLTEP